MNLTTDQWIPALWRDGTTARVTLLEVFERGLELQDLVVRPHERIVLMRLLVCIAQAALDGPADSDDWELCLPRIVPATLDYLERWKHAFELFGNGQRFLQVANLRKTENKKKSASKSNDDDAGSSASKLDLALSTGHNTTLFDNAGGSDRAFTPGDLALRLLTFQCFSPGELIGVALWNGAPTKGHTDHAPCVAGGMLHSLLRSDNLLGTVYRNLISKRQAERFFGRGCWGRPVWEAMPEGPNDDSRVRNANRTYLGRLVVLARAIWLADDRKSLILANGLDYASFEDGWRDPWATVVTRKGSGQPERAVLKASVDKSVWRVLHALTVKAADQNDIGGPAALQNVPDEEAFDLWTGGLVASKAKLEDTTESVFHIPAGMLGATRQRLYEKGVEEAENTASRVGSAVSAYHRELGDDLDRPEMRNRRRQIQDVAVTQFWTDMESAAPLLLKAVADPTSLGLNNEWHNTAWGRSALRAAVDAYAYACPHETPRQIRAWALGRVQLFAAPASQKKSKPKRGLKRE